ncbi:hypothetical protein [Streptomyces sp. NPDC046332]
MTDYRDDSLDLLHVDPDPDDTTTWCHWTDCDVDADEPHDHPAA